MAETRKFILTVDSTCDMPEALLQEHDVPVISMSYTLDGETYPDSEGHSLAPKEFYDRVRAGSMPMTAQVTSEQAKDFFRPLVESGSDVLHIAFSSALSGSCASAMYAAQELSQAGGPQIRVVDSLCASMGEGLLLHYAVQLRDEGKTLEEAVQWLEDNKLHLCHNFTVDDLKHLHRGGRVSRTSAIVGTLLGIKPVLHVDDAGRLIPLSKVRGRRAALDTLVSNMQMQVGRFVNEVVYISHGDCLADAEYVRDQVREKLGIKKFLLNPIGPVIGTHSGPGTVALFFLGEKR